MPIEIDTTDDTDRFEHRGHECAIVHRGVSPTFWVDGEKIPIRELRAPEVLQTDTLGPRWRSTLEKFIDMGGLEDSDE